jgi:hypothetical protein
LTALPIARNPLDRSDDGADVRLSQGKNVGGTRNAEPRVVVEEPHDERAQRLPLSPPHYAPKSALALLDRSPFFGRGQRARKLRFGKEPRTCELLLHRLEELPGVHSVGSLTGLVV